MSLAAALAAAALQAAQTEPSATPQAPPASPSSEAPDAPATAPPTIDSLLDQPPMSEDARQAAVRAAYDAAQARRGSLDGRWRLTARGGGTLYVFQLSDPGQVPDPRSSRPNAPVIEGSWLDPEKPNLEDGSGFLASVERAGDALTLHFDLSTDLKRERTVVLHRQASGDWAGELVINGAPHPVVMKRD